MVHRILDIVGGLVDDLKINILIVVGVMAWLASDSADLRKTALGGFIVLLTNLVQGIRRPPAGGTT